jgi:pimeloyl-ACP methyl ester carboxylesterase
MGVRLIAPDRPGCGLSTFKVGRRLEDWPEDLLQLADHLGFQSFTIIGNSGGGPYAAACAAYLPDRVEELLLLCGLGPTDIPECAKSFPRSSRLALAIARETPRIAAAITGVVFGKMYHEDRELFSEAMQSRLPQSDRLALRNHEWREQLASAVRESFRQGVRGPAWEGAVYAQPWKFSLSSIRVPSRLWHGEVDPIIPVEMGRHYARTLPGCQAIFYPDEGHFSLPCNRMAEIFQAVCH